jgi:hypothetical protein
LANAIDPKTGIIYYGEPGGEGGGDSSPRKMPLRFMPKTPSFLSNDSSIIKIWEDYKSSFAY